MITKRNPFESVKAGWPFSILPIALGALLIIGGCRKSELDKFSEESRSGAQKNTKSELDKFSEESRSGAQKNTCIANLKQLEGAIEQCKLSGKDNPSYSDIFGPKGYIPNESFCPIDKTKRYAIPVGSARPVCPNNGKGHILD